MKLFGRNIFKSILCTALVAVQAIVFAACSSMVYDDLEPCDEGLRLRFVYDYNLEYANGFPSQVKCLTLLVYDSDGKYIRTITETAEELLSDEDWRMTVDLPAGSYKLLAYGGLACSDASFEFEQLPGDGLPMTDVEVGMKPAIITSPDGTRLHDLFFGALDVAVPENATTYTEATVKMMKDTNNVRIVLQHVDGSPVNDADFTFRVTADNTLFNYDNNLIPNGITTFCPWAHGDDYAGLVAANPGQIYDEELEPVQVAYAEFSLSRFIYRSDTRIEINRVSDGSSVFTKPVSLISLLLMGKSLMYKDMEPQEYLDRQSRWSLIILLGNDNAWQSTNIVVNGWIVRINNIEA